MKLFIALLSFTTLAYATGSGQYTWDPRKDPESTNNMCYYRYCMQGDMTWTHRGDLAGVNRALSGQATSRRHLDPATAIIDSLWRLLAAGWRETRHATVRTRDEIPPASSFEGGRGASIRLTSTEDSNAQGGQFSTMWLEADAQDRVRVSIDDSALNEPKVKDLLGYCRCRGLTGQALATCCRNDNNQEQYDYDSKTWKYTDLANLVARTGGKSLRRRGVDPIEYDEEDLQNLNVGGNGTVFQA